MKLRIEIDPNQAEEVIIRAPAVTHEIRRIEEAVSKIIGQSGEIALKDGDEERFVSYDELLFFETSEDKVWAHTSDDCYFCPMRLGELERAAPLSFARASKGCLVNTALIRSISRSATGVGTASFTTSQKKVYISRMYYKKVRETIEETRLR
ncbi:MAG: LytTR family transcriptional regulator [Clostridia bacterium]|nr:LytTR family transcriptional regulator [Clostridia bacterium]